MPHEEQGGNVGREPAQQLVRPVGDHLPGGVRKPPQPRFEEAGIEPGTLDAHRAVLEGEGLDGVVIIGIQPLLDLGRSMPQQVRHLFLAHLDGAPRLVQDIAREQEGGGERSARQVRLDGQVALAFLFHPGPGRQGTAGEDLLAEFQMLFHFLAQAAGGPELVVLGLRLLELGQLEVPLALRERLRHPEVGDLLLIGEAPVPEFGILPILLRGNSQAVLVLVEQEIFRPLERFLLGLAQRVFRDLRGGQDPFIDVPEQVSRVRGREQALDGPVHDPGKVGPLVEVGDRGGGVVLEQEAQALRREYELEVQRKTEELAVSSIENLLDFGIDRKERIRIHQAHSLMLGRGSGDLSSMWHR